MAAAARARNKVLASQEWNYDEMLQKQGGVCALCRRPESKLRKDGTPMNLSVDHCHKTGKIRGLLCYRCNVALGFLEDDVETLGRAIKYLTSVEDCERIGRSGFMSDTLPTELPPLGDGPDSNRRPSVWKKKSLPTLLTVHDRSRDG
jgi:hypothetical protein